MAGINMAGMNIGGEERSSGILRAQYQPHALAANFEKFYNNMDEKLAPKSYSNDDMSARDTLFVKGFLHQLGVTDILDSKFGARMDEDYGRNSHFTNLDISHSDKGTLERLKEQITKAMQDANIPYFKTEINGQNLRLNVASDTLFKRTPGIVQHIQSPAFTGSTQDMSAPSNAPAQ